MLMKERQLSQLGVQMKMAVNHFGPFYLTYLLFQHIKKSKEARIINVASVGNNLFKKSTSQDLASENGFGSFDVYNKSKLANVQFTWGLAQRISKYSHIKTFSLHPGSVDTDIVSSYGCRNWMKSLYCLCNCCFVKAQTGARTSLFLSRELLAGLKNGEYYDDDETTLGKLNPYRMRQGTC